MRKTRELSRYLGITDDLRYVTSSGYTNDTAIALSPLLQRYFDNRITEVFDEGVEEATGTFRFLNQYTGTEVFDSSENLRPAFNNCWHWKNRLVCLPFTYMFQRYNLPSGWYYCKLGRLSAPTGMLSHTIQDVSSFEEWDAASRRAWWSMQPRFEGEIQMLNFLFELKDFKDIAKHAMKLRSLDSISKESRAFIKKLRRIDSRLYSAEKPISELTKIRDTGASATKISAQIRLANEFAIKPLISDWCAILHQAGQIVREVQDDFYKKGQAAQVRHYSESRVIQDSLVPDTGNYYYRSQGYYEKELFTATLDFKYNYSMRTNSDAFLTYWGLKFTPEVIWNGIPFSFLVDYMFKVGQSIHFMSLDPNVKVLPSQYCESLLRTYSHGYSVTGDQRAHLCVNRKTGVRGDIITGHTGSLFCRRVKPPNKGLATPIIRLPSGRQGANMAALAVCFIK